MRDACTNSPGLFSAAVLRRFVMIFIPAALLSGAVVWALYYQDYASDRSLHEQAATHAVDLHAAIIKRELGAVESDLLYLADQAVLREFLSGSHAGKNGLRDEYALFARQKASY